MEKIISFSIRNKLIVILFTLTIASFGLYSIFKIPVGAVPDITNNQVQIITTSGNLSTQEIEQFITAPVEMEMANLPNVIEIRSISKFGISLVTVVFDDDIGAYLPRQLIAEKIKTATTKIPENYGTPEMGPITTGLGEIYQYTLDVKKGYEGKYSAMELRTIQDWIIKRRLSGIDGVVEINSWGGYLKQYEVSIDPQKLKATGITLMEVFNALKNNNGISGGSYIEKTNQSYFIRGDGGVKSKEDIEKIVIRKLGQNPVLIGDIATVNFGYANRYGAITANGKGETILGQIMMLKDANSKEVINEVKKRVAEIQGNLPEGVYINPIVDRSELVAKTTFTVFENLILGAIIVMLIVVILLGNLRSALVIASMIPLALLFTISMMYIFGIDANLMSLGALDFGIIIDGAVIIVEFIALKLSNSGEALNGMNKEKSREMLDSISMFGSSKMMKSALFGQVIILIVFIPILTLTGVEGKMFQPMAITFCFAILGAMIFGLTWLPVASSLFLVSAKENIVSRKIMEFLKFLYRPVIIWAYGHKKAVLGAAIISLLITVFTFSMIGGEFVPTLDEGDFVIQPVLKTGTSLSKTIEMTTKMEGILMKKFPEVDKIVSRIGAAEVPTDPMSMEEIDMIIKLKPIKTWTSARTKEELAEKLKMELLAIPGIEYEFTQPIEMRFNELITGVRSDIAVKIFGDDLDYISRKADEIKALISNIPGANDVIVEKTDGLPQIKVVYNRDKIAYYGVDVKLLNEYLSVAFGGEIAGFVFEGEKRFDMVVRFDKSSRRDIDDVKNLEIPIGENKMVPFNELAEISYAEGPAKISRENTHRRVVVSINVRNRDLQSVVDDIRAKIDSEVILKPGNYIQYGGQFENLESAKNRLLFAVPVALLLIFIFLHFAFQSFKDAVMIFSAIPLATVGGVFLLWARGMPFSVSAGVGFIALFGIAVLNGIVLVEHLKELQNKGIKDMKELILTGTMDRLRPVILTAAAAAMGFLPMALSTGAGAEVQRPLATVVIGGLVTSTLLTMVALPLLFAIFNNGKKLKRLSFRNKSVALPLIVALMFSFNNLVGQREISSLDEAINLATKNNSSIKSYEMKLTASEKLLKTAFNPGKTSLSIGSDQNNIAENGYPLNVFSVEQSFDFPTTYISRKEVLKTEYLIEKQYLLKEVNKISLEVAKSYIIIQSIYSKVRVFKYLDSLSTMMAKQAALKYENGEISYLDFLNFEAKSFQYKNHLAKLEGELFKESTSLKSLLNVDSINIREIVNYRFDLPPVNIDSLPDSKIWRLKELLANLNADLTRNLSLPDFSTSYFVGTNQYSNSKFYHGFQVGVNIPIFYSQYRAQNQANILLAASENASSANSYNLLKANYISLLAEVKQIEARMNYYDGKGAILIEQLLKSAQLSFENGEIDYLHFANSVENSLQIELQRIDILQDFNISKANLAFLISTN